MLLVFAVAAPALAANEFDLKPPPAQAPRVVPPPVPPPPRADPSPWPWAVNGATGLVAIGAFAWAMTERRRRRWLADELARRRDYDAVMARARRRAEKRSASQ